MLELPGATLDFVYKIKDTLSSRAALGLLGQPLGRVRRASKGILHTTLDFVWANFGHSWMLRGFV